MRTFGRWGDLLFATAVVLVLPLLAGFPLPLLREPGLRVDPYQYWFPQTIHQLSQAALALLLMRGLSSMSYRRWGLNLDHWRTGLGVSAIFAVVWLVPAYWLVARTPAPATPITNAGIAAVLFSHFVITGVTQEILFRGLVMTFLTTHWHRGWNWRGWKLSHAGLLAAILFMLAHVKFAPPYFQTTQLVLSFVLGLYYAVLFERTGSLLGPSVSHNYSNGAYVALLLATHLLSSGR